MFEDDNTLLFEDEVLDFESKDSEELVFIEDKEFEVITPLKSKTTNEKKEFEDRENIYIEPEIEEKKEKLVINDYFIIRREVKDEAPLHKVNFWNKFVVLKKYIDRKSDKAGKELERKRQKELEENLQMEAYLRPLLLETLQPLRDKNKNIKEICLEILVPKNKGNIFLNILRGKEFYPFKYNLYLKNPNYEKLGINTPYKVEFSLNENFIGF